LEALLASPDDVPMPMANAGESAHAYPPISKASRPPVQETERRGLPAAVDRFIAVMLRGAAVYGSAE